MRQGQVVTLPSSRRETAARRRDPRGREVDGRRVRSIAGLGAILFRLQLHGLEHYSVDLLLLASHDEPKAPIGGNGIDA